MMRLSNTKARPVADDKLTLDAEKAKNALEREFGVSDEKTTD